MTKPAPAKLFDHGGAPVFVLMSPNILDQRVCLAKLNEMVEELPSLVTELQVHEVPMDSYIYVMHPVKKKVKDERGRFRLEPQMHLSSPIKLADCYKQGKNGYRQLDVDSVLNAITKACDRGSEPGARLFRSQLVGAKKDVPQSAHIKITDM